MRRVSGALAALAILIGMPAIPRDADGAVLCKKKSGMLVLRDAACNRKETAVDLSTLGAVGPVGPSGPDGPAGPTGPRGPSNGFAGSLGGPVTITTAVTPGDRVGRLDLPAGKYIISAKGWLENQSDSITTTAICTLAAGSDTDEVVLKIEPRDTNAFRAAFAVSVAHEFTSAGSAQLSCATGTGVVITANDAVITAIEVETLSTGALVPG